MRKFFSSPGVRRRLERTLVCNTTYWRTVDILHRGLLVFSIENWATKMMAAACGCEAEHPPSLPPRLMNLVYGGTQDVFSSALQPCVKVNYFL